MSLHDEYARLTPFEIAFPDRARFAALVAALLDAAESGSVDLTDPDAFATLKPVGDFLVERHGDVPRVELIQHGILLFHAVHFSQAGCPLYLLSGPAARMLVRSTSPGPSATPIPPVEAGYLQLPQHLFWSGAPGGDAPESVDGAFWTVSAADRLHVLPIIGVRPDRAGFGALSVPDAPLAHAADWVQASMREGSEDYSSRMEGAELDQLYAIETAGEVLKLIARFFAHAATAGGAPEAPHPALPSGQSGPRPSSLPYTPVRLVA
jgi:hypothetical protein